MKPQWWVDRKGEIPPGKKEFFQLQIFHYYKVCYALDLPANSAIVMFPSSNHLSPTSFQKRPCASQRATGHCCISCALSVCLKAQMRLISKLMAPTSRDPLLGSSCMVDAMRWHSGAADAQSLADCIRA